MLLCGATLLAGCSTVSDLFEDEPEAESRVSVPAESQGEQPFPNLSTVPDEAPETSSSEEREAISEGLAADRANAEYTDEPLGQPAAGASGATPPAAPQPAPAPPAPDPVSDDAGQTSQPPPPTEAAPAAGQNAPDSAGAVQAEPLAPPAPAPAPQPSAAPQPIPPPAPAPAAPPAPASMPSAVPSPAEQQVLADGSVIVNPDAMPGDGAAAGSRLLPSGESSPVALIFFNHGSARLGRNDIAVLREVVAIHRERGGLLRVIGHASQGSAGNDVARQSMANLNVSLARANAVAKELSRLGIPIDRIQVAAAGAQQPLFTEAQATGEAGNRRVEIYMDY